MVQFQTGRYTVPVSELEIEPEEPPDRLQAGLLASSTPYTLRLQSLYLQHAYKYDDLAGLSNARIEPTLHQVYVADRTIKKLRPRMLLADEVGLGKTIEAGLILKELTARGLVQRVLIVVPASLQFQWHHELSSKFNERFEIIDGPAARFLGRMGENPWGKYDRVICSLNIAASPKHADAIASLDWDLVIFDEAHRVRRTLQGGRKLQTTQAYALADELKETATGLLLLTATPMQLHPFELFSLIELIEPGLYATFEDYNRRKAELPRLNELMRALMQWDALSPEDRRTEVDRSRHTINLVLESDQRELSLEDIDDPQTRSRLMDKMVELHPWANVMVRNRKAEVGGFTPREAKRFLVELSQEELDVYVDVSEYIQRSYRTAQNEKRFAVGFLMVLYQRMLSSSSNAVRESFRRRIAKLRAQTEAIRAARQPSAAAIAEMRERDEVSITVDELDQLAANEAAIESEIRELEALVDRLGKIRDSKAAELVKAVGALVNDLGTDKVLIFTQYHQTQRFLTETLARNGLQSVSFNGSMNAEEKEAAVRSFRTAVPIMVSTEAGGEGRNFQFCHVLINYDLPWNPMKVEQRIGRIDRIGQKRKVFIYNIACAGTVEERILDVLETRIGLFEESVGSLDPILGELERDIERIIFGQAEGYDEAFEVLGARVEDKVRQARQREQVMADFILDRASFRRDLANELLGRRPLASHGDLRRFVSDCLLYFGGRLAEHVGGGDVILLSPRLTRDLRTRESDTRGVFDWRTALEREDLPFFAIGHALIDGVLNLPLDEGAAVGLRRIPGETANLAVEVFYQVEAEGLARSGALIRHLVDTNLSVVSERMSAMPEMREELDSVEIPAWAQDALLASERLFASERAIEFERIRAEHEARRAQETERVDRIHGYRQARLERLIADEALWIAEKEVSGSERDRRIMPARKGKLKKNEERLQSLEEERSLDEERLKSMPAGVAARMVAIGLVVGG